jgi:hypothetical protein
MLYSHRRIHQQKSATAPWWPRAHGTMVVMKRRRDLLDALSIDADAAAARLVAGRAEPARIIAAMRGCGVTVALIGLMRGGDVFPNSDVDLLLLYAGPMGVERAVYEIHALASGEIPIDVTVLSLVPPRLRARVLESLQHPDPLS